MGLVGFEISILFYGVLYVPRFPCKFLASYLETSSHRSISNSTNQVTTLALDAVTKTLYLVSH